MEKMQHANAVKKMLCGFVKNLRQRGAVTHTCKLREPDIKTIASLGIKKIVRPHLHRKKAGAIVPDCHHSYRSKILHTKARK
jgi:hypothetical protein